MIIGGQEFPDVCVPECRLGKEYRGQGDLCDRCPIFCCTLYQDEPGEPPHRILEPDDYRPDWAKAWKEWFDGGMAGYPKISL
jgi:hypothetical protein